MPFFENASNIIAHHCTFNDVQGHQTNYINYTANRSYLYQERRTVSDWLSPLNFKVTQSDVLSKRTEGTGRWLLDSSEFKAWLSGDSKELWCPGMPGAGKTILASIVIDYLQNYLEGKDAAIACIYCNYKEQTEQTVPEIIASLLKQLIQDRLATSDNVKSLYEQHVGRGTRPTYEELKKVFQSEVGTSNIYIVVDALDEYLERDQGYLITELRSLGSALHLMVTSRPLLSIEQLFQHATRLDILANDTDVRKYIEDRIAHEYRLVLHVNTDRALREIIIEKIAANVKGMFLLAKLHLNLLATMSDRRAVRNALDILPAEVKLTYDMAMERIASRGENDRKLAERVLSWITYAHRPLSLEELQHALAVSPGMSVLDSEAIVPEQILTSVCTGLVVIDKCSNIVRLVHYTAQEYFECHRELLFSNAQANIAAVCITYLSFGIFGNGYCHNIRELNLLLQGNPLLDYAASYWGHHVRGETEEARTEGVLEFLRKESNVACARQVLTYRRSQRFSASFPEDSFGLHLLSFFGLKNAMHRQLQNGARVDSKDMYQRSPLAVASENGHDGVVKLLLAQPGIDVNSKDTDRRTPLLLAAKNGHDVVVGLFLARRDVKVNLWDLDGRTPLSFAAGNGHAAVVKLFLERQDVKVNLWDYSDDRTPLSFAAGNGHAAVVRLFLEREDIEVNSKDMKGRTPLLFAAENGHTAVVELLLERQEIEVNSKGWLSRTSLSLAAKNSHEAVVRLLLEREDVEVNSSDIIGRTPLSFAAGHGYTTVVKLLLERAEVKVNFWDSGNRTPLLFAAKNGHEEVVRLLLEREDIKVNSRDQDDRTPLSFAAGNGHAGVVGLLLERQDIEVNSKGRLGRTPLSLAAKNGHDEVVRLLLERADVEVNSMDLYSRTPLSFAAENGRDGVVRLLLERHDIDVNTSGELGRTPLSLAAKNGHDKAVRLLLARADIDVKSVDLYARTPLSYAAENGRDEVVRLLLVRMIST